MRQYLLTMIGVCAVCFIVKQLGIFGDSKYVGFVCGICIVAVTLNPVVKLVEWISNIGGELEFEDDSGFEEYSSMFEGYLTEVYMAEIKENIEKKISDGYNIAPDDVNVSIYVLGEEIEKIAVTLTGSGIFANTNKMKSELEDTYGCEILIMIGK